MLTNIRVALHYQAAASLIQFECMASSCERHAMICFKSSLTLISEDRTMLIAYLPARRKGWSSLRTADCSRSHGGLTANVWHYRLSTGFFERIPGFEIGRFG